MFLRYCYLKIWAKYLIRTKIRHFEFTLSLITSGLRDLSKLKFGTGKFFGTKVQKSHLKYTKTSLTRKVGLICGTTIIQKKIFSSETKDNLKFAKIGAGFSFRSFKIVLQS